MHLHRHVREVEDVVTHTGPVHHEPVSRHGAPDQSGVEQQLVAWLDRMDHKHEKVVEGRTGALPGPAELLDVVTTSDAR